MPTTILIVDDDANLRLSLSKLLSRDGYDVTPASSGEEALQFLSAGSFHLAFIDLMMGGMGGIELLTHINSLHPDMPVLILTANATLDTAIDAVRQGARDYLVKPIDPELILARVKTVISEINQPQRQREIFSEIQQLVQEYNQLRESENSILPIFPPLSASDSTRFLQNGTFTLDLHTRHLSLDGKYTPISPTNFDYLSTLIRFAPNPVSYQDLVFRSQGYEVSKVEARDIARWRVHELRKIIEPDPKNPSFLHTVRGVGYRLITQE